MDSWKTFGHGHVKAALDRQLLAGHIPHAFLFAGPEGLGKKTLALEFAQKLLGSSALANHPDFSLLDVPGEITLEPLLEFIGRLGLKPFVASRKVAIINNAQNLNQASGNALLKTLEEPSSSTVLILISSSFGLLPTIVSRCQALNFYPFSDNELRSFKVEKNLDIAASALGLSFGSPAQLVKFADDPAALAEAQLRIGQYQKISKMSLGEKLGEIASYAEAPPEDLEKNFLAWLHWETANLGNMPQNFTKVRALLEAIKGLKMNKNKKLVLQGLLLKL